MRITEQDRRQFHGAMEDALGDFYTTNPDVSYEQHVELCQRIQRAIWNYREELRLRSARAGQRVYTPEETGGRISAGELVKHLAEVPQETAVFFCQGSDVTDEPICGLTAHREPVETVETVYWHKPDGPDAVGYVRLIGQRYPTWKEHFPTGRTIFYEGDDPEEFAGQIKAEFGYDPADDPGWGEQVEFQGENFTSYGFHCPPEHLDAIYGNDRFPMGS